MRPHAEGWPESEEIGVAHRGVQRLPDALRGVRKHERGAHHREILRLRDCNKSRAPHHLPDPGWSRPHPCFDPFHGIARNDMPQKDFDRRLMPRIEERISPEQAIVANPKHAPPDEAPPLPNGDDECARLGTVEIAPPEIPGIPPNKKRIGRRDASEEAIEFLSRIADELELISATPPCRASDSSDRHFPAPETDRLHAIDV